MDDVSLALSPDPLHGLDISDFASAFQKGDIDAEQVTKAYLERIRLLDKILNAFEYVDAERALASARAMDQLRTAGIDLGPLMGLPISVKDLFTVRGMPITVGSNIDITDLIDPQEGPFITALRRAGCVILGKTRMVEFSLGISGASAPRGTPWNPCDMTQQRLPGGSSSGAAVSVAGGLCAMAIGTDSGGSVRVPAALCGVFGFKTTYGLWPTDGGFPLIREVDSIGLVCRSARDAAVAYAQITGLLQGENMTLHPRPLSGVRLGKPLHYFFDGLTPAVKQAMDNACEQLQSAGAQLMVVSVPEATEREAYFPLAMPASLISILGRERFLANRDKMDPVVASRTAGGLEATAADYLALEARRHASSRAVAARFVGFDAWISSTTVETAPTLHELDDTERGLALALGMTRNTQPANYLGLCAASLPLNSPNTSLPIGFQLMGSGGSDMALLALAIEAERVFADGSIGPGPWAARIA